MKADWANILLSCRELGKVMALTRNEGCVLEHKGNFQKITIHGTPPHQIATVIGPIEQRVFFGKWKYGFAVATDTPRGIMRSLQFFDQSGEAVMKIYLQEKSNQDAYDNLIRAYRSEEPLQGIQVQPFEKETHATSVDQEAFARDWENMKDTHDFFGMLSRPSTARATSSTSCLKWRMLTRSVSSLAESICEVWLLCCSWPMVAPRLFRPRTTAARSLIAASSEAADDVRLPSLSTEVRVPP
ncbi:ChuX/HutX family heme-like substrate-binding protein, partial [Cyclobacterium sp.]|uniref:ChuX/HutX family heme-like substrate-binding protein n=1 Tax=Cyclobacterium sp. TaxID=1966343 RepID=UPI003970A88B